MNEPAETAAMLQNHPEALVEHYVFTCDAVDAAVRIRSLAGTRVTDCAVIRVACRLVYEGAVSLFQDRYEGFPGPADDVLLRQALADDELVHPGDYTAHSDIEKTIQRSRPRQDDMLLEIDFVDPQIGFAKGNILLVGRRSMRHRDRATVDELDAISAYFLAQKACDPTVKAVFVGQGRWPLVP